MILGIGTDIIEIERIKKVNKAHRLAKRILSAEEFDKYTDIPNETRQTEFLAGRFAVKEAYSKALGSGIGGTVAFREINCLNDSLGKPSIANDGRAHVSISHSEAYAMAMVVLETQ
jgi:holo-[acyl-carrier protein] synthase